MTLFLLAAALLGAREALIWFVVALDWRDGILAPQSRLQGYLAAHVSLARRIGRRVNWWRQGVVNTAQQQYRAVELAVDAHLSTVSTRPVDAPRAVPDPVHAAVA